MEEIKVLSFHRWMEMSNKKQPTPKHIRKGGFKQEERVQKKCRKGGKRGVSILNPLSPKISILLTIDEIYTGVFKIS